MVIGEALETVSLFLCKNKLKIGGKQNGFIQQFNGKQRYKASDKVISWAGRIAESQSGEINRKLWQGIGESF